MSVQLRSRSHKRRLFQPAVVSEFSLLDYSPFFWYDFSDTDTVWQDSSRTIPAGDGDDVDGVTDKSGNGLHGTCVYAAYYPRWHASAGSTGQPGISNPTPNTVEHITAASGSGLSFPSEMFVAMVQSATTVNPTLLYKAYAGVYGLNGPGLGANRVLIQFGASNYRYFTYGSSVTLQTPYLYSWYIAGGAQGDISSSRAWINGVELSVQSTVSSGAPTVHSNHQPDLVGMMITTDLSYVHESFAISGTPSDDDISSIHTGIMAKWGIS